MVQGFALEAIVFWLPEPRNSKLLQKLGDSYAFLSFAVLEIKLYINFHKQCQFYNKAYSILLNHLPPSPINLITYNLLLSTTFFWQSPPCLNKPSGLRKKLQNSPFSKKYVEIMRSPEAPLGFPNLWCAPPMTWED